MFWAKMLDFLLNVSLTSLGIINLWCQDPAALARGCRHRKET
ncbi:MAG: hypothetical protein OXI67_04000 [Candidatus Poribacteria bacterium]|nr:hypothetical protein [Candidatus Poribacteria bacterium]